MKDTFIIPLLHPNATSSVASPAMLEYDDMSQLDTGVAPHQLPEDLRRCLEVIENSILAGHLKLSEGLRKRYDEQYPLLRSLADVFLASVCFNLSWFAWPINLWLTVIHLLGLCELCSTLRTGP